MKQHCGCLAPLTGFNIGRDDQMPIRPELGGHYEREFGEPVQITAVGPFNAVGKTSDGKFLLFGLDGRGIGATGNLIVKTAHIKSEK